MTTEIKTIKTMNKMKTFELINGYLVLGTMGRKNQFGETSFLTMKPNGELLKAAKWLDLYRSIEKAVQPYEGCSDRTYKMFHLSTEVRDRNNKAYKRVENLIPSKSEVEEAYSKWCSEKKETKKEVKKEQKDYTVEPFENEIRFLFKNKIPKIDEIVDGHKIVYVASQFFKGSDKYCYAYIS